MVRFAAKVGIFLLAVVLSGVPTMACLLPTVTLTTAEHECCKRMAGQCGGAGMSTSHSCCQRLAGLESNTFIKSSSSPLAHQTGASVFSPANAPVLLSEVPSVAISLDSAVHSPPVSPPDIFSVLRI